MLIFDFDGVLINSVNEVALTSYNAVTSNLFTSLSDAPNGPIELFIRNRFHVQPIGDAITLMKWCLGTKFTDLKKTLSGKEYQSITTDETTKLIDRTNLIYETRRRFIDTNTKRWLALHGPYQPLWSELAIRKNYPIVILTNKNHDATELLCRKFGLRINANDIYSGDQGVTKVENMRNIRKRFGNENFYFIDDSIKNLKDLGRYFNEEKTNLSLLLATWGYTGIRDAQTARQFGCTPVNQSDVIQLIKLDH